MRSQKSIERRARHAADDREALTALLANMATVENVFDDACRDLTRPAIAARLEAATGCAPSPREVEILFDIFDASHNDKISLREARSALHRGDAHPLRNLDGAIRLPYDTDVGEVTPGRTTNLRAAARHPGGSISRSKRHTLAPLRRTFHREEEVKCRRAAPFVVRERVRIVRRNRDRAVQEHGGIKLLRRRRDVRVRGARFNRGRQRRCQRRQTVLQTTC